MIGKVIFSVMLFATACHAHTCTSYNQHPEEISFDFARNSAALSSKDMMDFANWSVYIKNKYPLQWASVVSASAAPYEKNPSDLATHRADLIKAWAVKFGLAKIRIESSIELPKDVSDWRQTAQAGGIDFIPGCPNDCCD